MRRSTVHILVALVVWAPTMAADPCLAADPPPSPTKVRLDVPVGIPWDLGKLPSETFDAKRFALEEVSDEKQSQPIAVQFEPAGTHSTQGIVWFVVNEANAGEHRYRPVPTETVLDPWKLRHDREGQAVELWEGDARVFARVWSAYTNQPHVLTDVN